MSTTLVRRSLRALGVAALAVLTAFPLAGTAQAAGSGTPCGISNGACVALGSQGFNGTAWMVRGGRVVRGPVFFTPSGVAFHGTQAGDDSTNRTAGCVRLANGDASYFFSHLSVGDTVQVVRGSGNYGHGDSGDDDRGRGHRGGGGGILGGL
jgi:hypothetical protein